MTTYNEQQAERRQASHKRIYAFLSYMSEGMQTEDSASPEGSLRVRVRGSGLASLFLDTLDLSLLRDAMTTDAVAPPSLGQALAESERKLVEANEKNTQLAFEVEQLVKYKLPSITYARDEAQRTARAETTYRVEADKRVEAAEAENEKLSAQLVQKDTEIGALSAECERLSKEGDALRARLATAEEAIARMVASSGQPA
jgi:hypothetical protein